MQIENIINGVSVECRDETSEGAKVILRDPRGEIQAVIKASSSEGNIRFTQQQSSPRVVISHYADDRIDQLRRHSQKAQQEKARFRAYDSAKWEDIEYLLREYDLLHFQLAQVTQERDGYRERLLKATETEVKI